VTPTQNGPRLSFRTDARPVTGFDAAAHRLKPRPFENRKFVGLVDAAEVWIEATLTNSWRIAYRIIPEGRRAVVAELRILPVEVNAPAGWWTGHVPGAQPRVPSGGVTTKLLRSVTLGHDLQSLEKILQAVQSQYGPDAFTANGPYDVSKGFGPLPRQAVKRPRSGRGRPAQTDLEYARLAADYVRERQAAGNPILRLARKRRQKASTVRSAIARARSRGMLTETPRQGVAGGDLTNQARRILAESANK
jgi:hypothetical protein